MRVSPRAVFLTIVAISIAPEMPRPLPTTLNWANLAVQVKGSFRGKRRSPSLRGVKSGLFCDASDCFFCGSRRIKRPH